MTLAPRPYSDATSTLLCEKPANGAIISLILNVRILPTFTDNNLQFSIWRYIVEFLLSSFRPNNDLWTLIPLFLWIHF